MNDSLWQQLQQIPREDWPQFIKKNHPDLWLQLAWTKVNEWRDNQQNQAKVLGDTPDYSRELFTLDDRATKMVNYAFQKYWEDGLVYKGAYLVNWSVGLQTAVSDVAGEIEYEKRTDPFVTFEYEIKGTTTFKSDLDEYLRNDIFDLVDTKLKRLQVSTVRPETIFGDVAIAIHPQTLKEKLGISETAKVLDELLRTKQMEIYFRLPSLNMDNVKMIIADEVDPNFGTGALKITPASSQEDYDIFNKYIGGNFPHAIGRDGKLTEVCGEFAGLTVEQGRLAVIKRLAETGYIPVKEEYLKTGNQDTLRPTDTSLDRETIRAEILAEVKNNLESESFDATVYSYAEGQKRLQEMLGEAGKKLAIDWNYEHNVSICERSKTVIEPLISEEFFLSYQTPAKSTGKTLGQHGFEGVSEVQFFSADYQERANNFIENIHDWCISRDLVWGHKIPVWYNLDVNPEKRLYSKQEIDKMNKDFKNTQTENDAKNSPFSERGGSPSETGYVPKWRKAISNPSLKEKARELRQSGNLPEVIFWNAVKNKQLGGFDFTRQKVIGNYILDFFVDSLGVGIEIDGESHDQKGEYDVERGRFLKNLDLEILHFSTDQIKKDLDSVLQSISDLLASKRNTPSAIAATPFEKGEYSSKSAKSESTLLPIKIQPTKPTEPGNWVQETKIFDTWFSSTLWPLSTLDFVEYKQKEEKLFVIHGGDSFETETEYLEFIKNWNLSPQDYLDIDSNWGSWKRELQKSFKNSHIQVIYPSFPDKLNAKYKAWKIWFEKILVQTGSNNLSLLGHSLGGNFLLKYLSENELKVKNLYLVASCQNIGDFKTTGDFDLIQKNCENITIYHSKDDQVVPFSVAQEIASKLPKAKLVEFENRGHFVDSEFVELKSQISADLRVETKTDFERFYPTQEMTTAKEIFYIWIVRMIILGKYFTGKIPFEKVIITPTILDEKGRKMSKSLGNGLDPVVAIDQFSSDSLRLAMLGGMIPNRNMKMGGKLAENIMQKYRNFGNKIWNVARFLESKEGDGNKN